MGPGGVRLGDDGFGAATVAWEELQPKLSGTLQTVLEDRVGEGVEIVGVRLLDADGRELSLTGLVSVVVGFRRALAEDAPRERV